MSNKLEDNGMRSTDCDQHIIEEPSIIKEHYIERSCLWRKLISYALTQIIIWPGIWTEVSANVKIVSIFYYKALFCKL